MFKTFKEMEFSKKMLLLHSFLTVTLILVSILLTVFTDRDVSAIAVLAGTSFVVDGTWGGFYLWKSKNENRAKYAQQFVELFANEHGVDSAIRIAEIVLKD